MGDFDDSIWFRGGALTDYDKSNEVEQRGWHAQGLGQAPSIGTFEPIPISELADENVHYYQDTWARLKIVSPFGRS